jgi:hypothetical protein
VPTGAAFVHATFDDVSSTLLLVEPKELVASDAVVEVSVEETGDGVALVTLEADAPALSTMVWLDGVDARWSDNVLDLLPGEPRTISVRSAAPIADRLRWRALQGRSSVAG